VRLGLLGGTFDPIHMGHLLVAEVARHALALDRVLFVPAGDPPHKGESVTAAEHRYAMTLLATGGNEAFQVSRRELERAGPSYSLVTIGEMQAELPAGGELFFIVGADAILEIRTWYRWEDVLRACRFLAVSRPGFGVETVREVLPLELIERVQVIPSPGFDLSSTEIRERVRLCEPIRYLVPDEVEVYIRKHGLYRAAIGGQHRATDR
jgi:nicotinate-nucleotide adenylyltransferase